MSRVGKYTETDNRLCLPGKGELGGNEETDKGYLVSFWGDETEGGGGNTTL